MSRHHKQITEKHNKKKFVGMAGMWMQCCLPSSAWMQEVAEMRFKARQPVRMRRARPKNLRLRAMINAPYS
eukprot:1160063-Pelagomonas_calceolata.AAC.2